MPETRPPVSRYRAARTMLSFAWAADRRRTVLSFVLLGLEALVGSVFALWLKFLLDGLHRADLEGIALGAAGLAVSIGGSAALSYAGSRVQATLQDRAKQLVGLRTLELMGRTPTLEIHEDPRHLAQLEAFRLEGHAFSNVFPSLIESFAMLVRIVTTSLLLVGVHPLLLALPLFGAPALVLSAKTSGLFYVGVQRASVPQRRSEHLLELTATPGGAKEVRLFRLGAELLARFHATHKEIRHIHHSMQVRAGLIGLGTRLVFLLGYVGAIAFVVSRAVRGEATVGDAVLTAVLAGQVLGLVTGSAEVLQTILKALVAASRWVYLHDVAERARQRINPSAVVPPRLGEGIRLEDVSYRYPLAERDALSSVDLLLPAGATVAVVGDNGAGKSTLVKLLAGMYLPTSGRITADGVDLAEVDPVLWRLRVSAGFQDHARFELLARETIGIGDLSALSDDPAITAAADRAGATDVLHALPAGLATQLGAAWDGGVDLSGGQWQKLALARAMMREAPLLLLLDEPTAALDADTEHQLFEHWTTAARDLRRRTGAITMLVSHRFSTVRMADLIVVVDDARIVETGTHAELIARNGLYAELFEIQARSYRSSP